MDKNWYKKLNKSRFTPPPWTFGLVWPLLYTSLIIYFLLMIIKTDCNYICDPLIFFIAQTFLNIIWPYIFFKLKDINFSFLILVIMDIFTLLTIILTKNSYKFILYPYFLWILFATYLTGYIVFKN